MCVGRCVGVYMCADGGLKLGYLYIWHESDVKYAQNRERVHIADLHQARGFLSCFHFFSACVREYSATAEANTVRSRPLIWGVEFPAVYGCVSCVAAKPVGWPRQPTLTAKQPVVAKGTQKARRIRSEGPTETLGMLGDLIEAKLRGLVKDKKKDKRKAAISVGNASNSQKGTKQGKNKGSSVQLGSR